jgi:hypothetical protein
MYSRFSAAVQGLARHVFLGDLTLEFRAVGAEFRSILNMHSVHRQGRTPTRDSFSMREVNWCANSSTTRLV